MEAMSECTAKPTDRLEFVYPSQILFNDWICLIEWFPIPESFS